MPDNIYDVKVGDNLTPEQIRLAVARGGKQQPQAVPVGAPVGGEGSIRQLKYPLEDTDYKARVIFSLNEDKPTGTNTQNVFASQTKKLRGDLEVLKGRVSELNEEIEGGTFNGSRELEKQQLLQKEKELIEQIRSYEGLEKQSNSTRQSIPITTSSISLYLPLGLAFRDNVTYENFDLGAAGASMEAGLGFAESMVKGLGSFVSQLTSGDNGDLAKLAGVQLASQFGSFGAEAQAASKLAGGVTLNPNSRILFKQPNIREFSFAFKMIAKSKKEAREINEIIKLLRTELYPDEILANVGDASISLGYKFPNKFNIAFEYDGDKIPGLAKIKPCYLRDVSTTFNASQMAMHEDGNFMEVDMTLSFQETKALVRKDVSEGGF
jgi:hypothetical protein